MAVLNSVDLQDLRANCAKEIAVRYEKAVINAVLQAVEDVFEGAAVRNALSNAIDTASQPLVFTNAEKRSIIKFWLASRFGRGN